VSAHASASDLNVAPRLPIASMMLSRSRVDRARRSRRVTISVSPTLVQSRLGLRQRLSPLQGRALPF
jgi:hypothetical protein